MSKPPKDKDRPRVDRGWGGAGAVGWGVLGAFGSHEKDTKAQVAKKGTGMVKNEAGLWVKAKGGASRNDEDMDGMPPPMGRGRGRGRGIPVGQSDPTFELLSYKSNDNDRRDSPPSRSESPPRRRRRESRDSRSSSESRSRSSSRGRRSPSRKKRKRSRGRERRDSRERNRRRRSSSRSTSRHRDRRKRSRSRSRRKSPESRRRSRSPDGRKHRRSRSPRSDDRRRDSSRRKEEPSHRDDRGKDREREELRPETDSRAKSEEKEEEPIVGVLKFTAAQVTDHLVEVYNGSSPNRLEEILECFNPDVRLLKLSGGAKIMEGAKALQKSMPADSSNCMAECSKRLYMESSNGEEPTFCLDFYRTGAAPGISAFGKGGVKLPTVLLYRVLDNKIDHIWIAPDKEEICNARALNAEKVRVSSVFSHITEILNSNLTGKISYHFHDYDKLEVWGV